MSDELIIDSGAPETKINPTNGSVPTKEEGFLSICPGPDEPLDDEITAELSLIQSVNPDMPLWLIMQDGDDDVPLSDMGFPLWRALYNNKDEFEPLKPIMVLCVSPGGQAEPAFRIAKFLRNKCGSYKILIPKQSKSAATLLALGASEIIMGENADLGPIDVQIGDHNEERIYSGLDEVQSVDGLFELANNQILTTTMMWSNIMGRKKQLLLPTVIDYVTGMIRPLMEKIDAVHYMSLSRTLRIAQEYAFRLLQNIYGPQRAKMLAKKLVENYPYHGFIIDITEAKEIGLKNVVKMTEKMQNACDTLLSLTDDCSIPLIGKFYTKNHSS